MVWALGLLVSVLAFGVRRRRVGGGERRVTLWLPPTYIALYLQTGESSSRGARYISLYTSQPHHLATDTDGETRSVRLVE